MPSDNIYVPSLNKLLNEYNREYTGLRFGQYFINNYYSQSWPELYYEENLTKSIDMVNEWLYDNCYENDLPKKLEG